MLLCFPCLLEEDVTLQGLLALLTQRPEYKRLLEQIRNADGLPALTGINESAHPYVVAAIAQTLKQPMRRRLATSPRRASSLSPLLMMSCVFLTATPFPMSDSLVTQQQHRNVCRR